MQINIDVEKALATLELPPGVCYASLPPLIKLSLKTRIAQEYGPQLRPVLCPCCLANDYVVLRYFNNRGRPGQLQARFLCTHPYTCIELVFTLKSGGRPPVIAKKNRSPKALPPSPDQPDALSPQPRPGRPRKNSITAAETTPPPQPSQLLDDSQLPFIPRRPRTRRQRTRPSADGAKGLGGAPQIDVEEEAATSTSKLQHPSLADILFEGLEESLDESFYSMPISQECIGDSLGPLCIVTSLDF